MATSDSVRADADTEAPALVAQTERHISRVYYSPAAAWCREASSAVGVALPLYAWTHRGDGRVVTKVLHLLDWVCGAQAVDSARVAVVLPLQHAGELRARLPEVCARWPHPAPPAVLASHELTVLRQRGAAPRGYDLVVCAPAMDEALFSDAERRRRAETYLCDALNSARGAFVLCVDAAWLAPAWTVRWPTWKNFVQLLANEQPPVAPSAAGGDGDAETPAEARFPSLVGARLPLCCARHPLQLQQAYGLVPIASTCQRYCLAAYACGHDGHVCRERCHPSGRHSVCPYACAAPLACGHRCLMGCGARCNCLEVGEHALDCSHRQLLGADRESGEPIYARVRHVFRGVCADAQLPCEVEYDSQCARCRGPLRVRCGEAAAQQHTAESPTVVCEACRRTERELQARVLADTLVRTTKARQTVQMELRRTLFQQRKAAAGGIFKPGARVEITDAAKLVEPLMPEDEFPGVVFADVGDPAFLARVEGAYGTFLSSHVDPVDPTELRSLVRLPDGAHVLVTDGGLRMIRAIRSSVRDTAAALMITYAGAAGEGEPKEEGEGAAAPAADDPAFAAARKMVGGVYYLGVPAACPGAEGGSLSDVLVTAAAVDPASPEQVIVECVLPHPPTLSSTAAPAIGEKRPRDDSGAADTDAAAEPAQRLRLAVRMGALEDVAAVGVGKDVYVVDAGRQIRSARALECLNALLPLHPEWGLRPGSRVSAVPVDNDSAYTVVALLNPPRSASSEAEGDDAEALPEPAVAQTTLPPAPLALLRWRKGATAASGAGRELLAAVPYAFLLPDELSEAVDKLDAAAREAYAQRLEELVAAAAADAALRHEEDAFHALQQMPPVTPEMRAAERVAYSIPAPLPSAAAVAAARRAASTRPSGDATAARMLRLRDSVLAKKEPLELRGRAADVRREMLADAAADREYAKTQAPKMGK